MAKRRGGGGGSGHPGRRREDQQPSAREAGRAVHGALGRDAAEAATRAVTSAMLRGLAQPSGIGDPRRLGGNMVDVAGDSRAQGGVVVDLTDVVLLDRTEVCTVDAVRKGVLGGQVIFMTLDGRINKTTDRTRVGYMLGPDGAAALITQLLAVADRFGVELLDDVTRRLTSLHQGKHVDLHFLRAAIDAAIESEGEGEVAL